MNYPTIQDAPKFFSYKGHSGKIRRIIWTPDDDKIITIAENDNALILWNVEEIKEDY
jgi:WD40 repeat protein